MPQLMVNHKQSDYGQLSRGLRVVILRIKVLVADGPRCNVVSVRWLLGEPAKRAD